MSEPTGQLGFPPPPPPTTVQDAGGPPTMAVSPAGPSPTGPSPTGPSPTMAINPAGPNSTMAINPAGPSSTMAINPAGARPAGPGSNRPGGQPPGPPGNGSGGWRVILGSLAAAIVVVALLIGLVAVTRKPAAQTGTAGGSPTSTVGPGVSLVPAAPTSTTVPTTVVPATVPPETSSTTTATTVAVETTSAAQLVVNTPIIDFGTRQNSLALAIGNSGAKPLQYTAAASSPLLSLNPDTGTVPPGGTVNVTVTFGRAAAPVGQFSGTVTLTTSTGASTVPVAATVTDPGPSITNITFSTGRCDLDATIKGRAQITSAVLTWGDQLLDMQPQPANGNVWSAHVTDPNGAKVTWSITASDANGVKTTTPPKAQDFPACTNKAG